MNIIIIGETVRDARVHTFRMSTCTALCASVFAFFAFVPFLTDIDLIYTIPFTRITLRYEHNNKYFRHISHLN